MSPHEPVFHLRALREPDGLVRLVAGNVTLGVEGALPLDEKSAHPSALDLLVGALAADLLTAFDREAAKSGTPVHEAELRLTARLDNPLLALGVVGETGSAGLAGIDGMLAVSTDAPEVAVRALWERSLARSPVHVTLSRTTPIRIDLRLFD